MTCCILLGITTGCTTPELLVSQYRRKMYRTPQPRTFPPSASRPSSAACPFASSKRCQISNGCWRLEYASLRQPRGAPLCFLPQPNSDHHMEGSIASTNVEIVPSWENPPPYKGRSAHCAPMLLEPHMAPLRQSSPIPSNTSIRPSISHLYNQHQPLLQAGSGLNIAPHHTSTSSHAFPAVSQMGHVHNNFGAEPGHRAHTHQRKQSFGGLSAQSVANHPLMPPFVNQPALYSSSAETFMPTYGALHNESFPYHMPLTPEQHPHALHQKKQPVLHQQYPTVTPVSSSAIAAVSGRYMFDAAVSGRYMFDPAAPEFFSSKIHSQPIKLEQQMELSFKSKPQQPVSRTFMPKFSPQPAQTIPKEPASFAQLLDPPQQQQQNGSGKASTTMCAAVQLASATSTATATASAEQKSEEPLNDKSSHTVAPADAPNMISQDRTMDNIMGGGFRGIQEIAASMTKLLPNVADSDTDYENLMIGLLRIQVLASMTHHKAKQVRQQQAEAQLCESAQGATSS